MEYAVLNNDVKCPVVGLTPLILFGKNPYKFAVLGVLFLFTESPF